MMDVGGASGSGAGFAGEGRRKHSDVLPSGFRKPHRRTSRDPEASTVLPAPMQSRLHHLFREVEKEFEAVYLDNLRLREKIALMEKGGVECYVDDKAAEETDAFEAVLKTFAKKNAKTRHKLKAHTSKIVSSFKAPQLSSAAVKEYGGHRDGIWDIAVMPGHPLIGTASADKTARIWGIDSAKCLLTYAGHGGSVNAISFHPTQDLALTASGDGTAHVWSAAVIPDNNGLGGGTLSSDESGAESSEDGGVGGGGDVFNSAGGGANSNSYSSRSNIVRQPVIALSGHQGVVIGCQWLDNELAVTAGWDRVANLYNVETGALLQTLAGHDGELTHVACHASQRLVATCSNDSTFRLWDFRETIHSVSVFQGHTEPVTSASFSSSDRIVSGSDDRSVKVWDLRNMRAPVTNIQCPSAVNRIAVSQSGTIAVPHDNRQVTLHDLSGQKLLRLPRDGTRCHHRMVTSTCWASAESSENWRSRANLFSAGFDRVAFGWSVRSSTRDKDEGFKVKEKEKAKDATF